MNVIDVSIDNIIPYENNPRNNENAVEKVTESIKQFGFKVPIIIDRDNVIVAGHTRLLAANKLGLKTVPCIIADDLTEEQVKAFRLADNKVSEFSTWNFEKLELEMSEINLDMEIFGFDSIEDIDCNDNEVIEDDFSPDIPEEPKAKLGDVYQLGNHRLMCGNSTSASDIGKLLNGAHIHLFLFDPPYGISVVQRSKIGGDKAFGKVGGGKIVNSNSYMSIKGDDTTETARENYDIVSQITDNQIILLIFYHPELVGAFGIKKIQVTLLTLKWRGLLLIKELNYITGYGMVYAEKVTELQRELKEYIPHKNLSDCWLIY